HSKPGVSKERKQKEDSTRQIDERVLKKGGAGAPTGAEAPIESRDTDVAGQLGVTRADTCVEVPQCQGARWP
ncbi:MAG: hypothetical protein ACREUP_02360, partial [Burkholderiales bacterium]